MRIGITGSWKDKDKETWKLLSDLKSFKDACHQLGAAIAQSGAALTVGSDSDFTADKHAVEGYLSNYTDVLSVRVVRPQKGRAPFPDLYREYPNAFVYLPGASASWRHTRQQFVADIDALVTVGGGDGTYQAALELRLTRKRLVPVGAFGGASSRLLAELLNSHTLRNAEVYERLSNPWALHLASHVVAVLGANRPSRILLIHGHAEDRIELEKWLRHQKLARIIHEGRGQRASEAVSDRGAGWRQGRGSVGFGVERERSGGARCPAGQGGSLAARAARSAQLCRWG